MRTAYLGGDDPAIAVVGGIHGDEPCGVRAVETILSESPDFERPVVFVVVNERALESGTRYIDEDLNRAFPGDANGDTHESRLAARLQDVIGDCLTLSMHSTQSYDGPFALVNGVTENISAPLEALTVDAVVDVGEHSKGRLFDAVPDAMEVECGLQGSEEAAERATALTREFLVATGALSPDSESAPERTESPETAETPLFRLDRKIPKTEARQYEVYASNFEEVPAGEPYAAAGEEPIVAEDSFYPVLLSSNGYENVFGYSAERLGTGSK